MRLGFLARANKRLLVAGVIVVLAGLSDAGFAVATRYLFDRPATLKLLTYVDDHGLLPLGRRASVHWSEGRDVMLQLDLDGPAGSGGLYLCYHLSPERETQSRENAANEPGTYLFDLKNGLRVYLWTRDKAIVDLIHAFDPSHYPQRRSTLLRVLFFEASNDYKWGIDLSSHHGLASLVVMAVGAARFLMACPVIALMEMGFVRTFILGQGITIAGLVMVAASLVPRRGTGTRVGTNRVGGGFAPPSSHTTGHAGPHPAVHQVERAS